MLDAIVHVVGEIGSAVGNHDAVRSPAMELSEQDGGQLLLGIEDDRNSRLWSKSFGAIGRASKGPVTLSLVLIRSPPFGRVGIVQLMATLGAEGG